MGKGKPLPLRLAGALVLGRSSPDEAEGIEAEPGLAEQPDEFVAMTGEIRDFGRRDLTVMSGEFAEAFDFSC